MPNEGPVKKIRIDEVKFEMWVTVSGILSQKATFVIGRGDKKKNAFFCRSPAKKGVRGVQGSKAGENVDGAHGKCGGGGKQKLKQRFKSEVPVVERLLYKMQC